eukprot:TRINITY_DN4155_c0_g1_i7.p1 TRINITY_DN4155_c0_g1~~TRINITY_DN4155_c0_g1_i7.p1  ORF type:complete len:239 (-),score=49.01 TRINITY_DN4155_c0_g1_i7:931-1647(-)
MIETNFLDSLIASPEDLEPLADDCQSVFVWHVKFEAMGGRLYPGLGWHLPQPAQLTADKKNKHHFILSRYVMFDGVRSRVANYKDNTRAFGFNPPVIVKNETAAEKIASSDAALVPTPPHRTVTLFVKKAFNFAFPRSAAEANKTRKRAEEGGLFGEQHASDDNSEASKSDQMSIDDRPEASGKETETGEPLILPNGEEGANEAGNGKEASSDDFTGRGLESAPKSSKGEEGAGEAQS